ncbi:MAG: class I mannose-6-phosphate isomerase [Bacteroidales bacterium]|nr:class I mannose-6-phosphate isomerase [Bacteroidales bacterium]
MNSLYPLKFEPIIKDLIWGGSKLKTLLNKEKATEKSGESWEISGVNGNISVISNGFLAGNSLTEIIEVYMGDLVGQKVFDQFGNNFPLLIKFIDACDDLSIQVHPNDETAMQRHNSFGKTEMWYVMQADTGSQLIAGFKQNTDKESFLENLNNNTLHHILNYITVKPGDVFFMPAGRIHAIGKGILLAEIQQTSDITYRVYDYNRRDAMGNARELHTSLALDVIDYNTCADYTTPYAHKQNKPVPLANCNYFTTNLLELTDIIERDMAGFDSFIVYICTEGNAEILYADHKTETISKGETILIPAEMGQYYLKALPKATLLEVYIAYNPEEDAD